MEEFKQSSKQHQALIDSLETQSFDENSLIQDIKKAVDSQKNIEDELSLLESQVRDAFNSIDFQKQIIEDSDLAKKENSVLFNGDIETKDQIKYLMFKA